MFTCRNGVTSPHISSPQLLQQPPKTSPVKHLPLVQHTPDFFHQRRANHFHSLLPRISCRQEPLERLPRLGRITVTNLVLDHIQDQRFKTRRERRPILVRLACSSGLSYRLKPLAVLLSKARLVFYERLELCYPRVERLGIACPSLAIRSMRTRWGSCSRSGLVILNPRLVQTPVDCIDYGLLHELCHLKEHNHGKQYYQLLDQTLPDWRERRRKLNQFEFY